MMSNYVCVKSNLSKIKLHNNCKSSKSKWVRWCKCLLMALHNWSSKLLCHKKELERIQEIETDSRCLPIVKGAIKRMKRSQNLWEVNQIIIGLSQTRDHLLIQLISFTETLRPKIPLVERITFCRCDHQRGDDSYRVEMMIVTCAIINSKLMNRLQHLSVDIVCMRLALKNTKAALDSHNQSFVVYVNKMLATH